VLFRSFGDSSLDFELRVWVADVDTRLQVASDLHQDIDRRFRLAGIAIPFPQRDLHVRSVEPTNTMAAIVKAPLD
jgi:small-conductance mechanosensitive channel